MRNLLYIFILCFISCNVTGQGKQKYLHVNPTVYLALDEEQNKFISFLENFFSTEWEHEKFENMLLQPMDVLHGIYDIYWELLDYPYFKPTLLALQNVSEAKTIAKVSFTYPTEDEFSYVFATYNFMIHETEEGLKLSNIFEHQISNWKSVKKEGNTYYTAATRKFNFESINKMNRFNTEMASYFNTKPIQFAYYTCKDMEEAYSLRGYDYESSMYYNGGIGAFAYPRYNSIFSANNTEYYPHELVHLYTYKLFSNKHRSMDEGLAGYLGGSLNLDFEDSMIALKAYLNENEVDLFAYAFLDIDKDITVERKPIEDLIFAFLCYYTEKEYGKESLFELMDSGRTNEDLLLALEKNIGLNKENFNAKIKEEIRKSF